MSYSLHNFVGRENRRREFKKQLRLTIIITLGFTIAFTWRQTLFDLSIGIMSFFTHINNNSTLSVLASTLITIISIAIIYLTSRFLKD